MRRTFILIHPSATRTTVCGLVDLKETLIHTDCWLNVKSLHHMLWCQQESALVEKIDFISLRKGLRSKQRIVSKSCYHYLSTTANSCCHLVLYYNKMALQLNSPARLTQHWLKTNCTDFIALDEWPPNSPDLNPVDYHVWCAMLEAYHKLQPRPKTIPEMKIALQQIWIDLPHTPINKAVNDFRKRLQACISAGGGHFEHAL